MNIKITTQMGTHHVVIINNKITIVRLGGSIKVSYEMSDDVSFLKGITRIHNLCEFADEVLEEIGILS